MWYAHNTRYILLCMRTSQVYNPTISIQNMFHSPQQQKTTNSVLDVTIKEWRGRQQLVWRGCTPGVRARTLSYTQPPRRSLHPHQHPITELYPVVTLHTDKFKCHTWLSYDQYIHFLILTMLFLKRDVFFNRYTSTVSGKKTFHLKFLQNLKLWGLPF